MPCEPGGGGGAFAYSASLLLIDQMHIAERVRKAADDEVDDRSTQVLVSVIEARVDHKARARERAFDAPSDGPACSFSIRSKVSPSINSDLAKRVEQAE